MRIYYHLSHYISHCTAGQAYMDALRGQGVEFADTPAGADVLILHDDPLNLPDIIRTARDGGNQRLIAYSVWEADILPRAYADCLRGVDRVWTCTPFSARAFAGAGFAVDVVPHVVTPPRSSQAEIDGIKERIGFDERLFYFYTVADSVNPRKNLKTLLSVFAAAFRADPDVRLVVKQYRHPWDLSSLDKVIAVDEELSPGAMAALHRVCHAFVSAHHAEAWGLSLSDAMAAGNPVIATGYSGNMHYMDETNSLPVNFTTTRVPREMCELVPLFTGDMTWADPDPGHLAHCMRRAAKGRFDAGLPRRAAEAMRAFAPQQVGPIMRALLDTRP